MVQRNIHAILKDGILLSIYESILCPVHNQLEGGIYNIIIEYRITNTEFQDSTSNNRNGLGALETFKVAL